MSSVETSITNGQESAIPRLRQKESKTVRCIAVRDLDFKDAESMEAGR